jgi:hypothetical protein
VTEQPPHRVIRADFHAVIHADFQNADAQGRVRLNTAGALAAIASLGIELEPDMRVLLIDGEELTAVGTVMWSEAEKIWVAEVDWDDAVKASTP